MAHDGQFVDVVAFSPDGTQLATGSVDNTVRLRDALTGRELTRMEHDSGVYAIAFSPDGSQPASASPDTRIRLWSA